MLHCTIHRQNRRFHITDQDFVETSDNSAQAAAKRILDWKTDDLIEDFARRFPLPAGHLPADEYLWIPEWEVSPVQLSYLSVETRGKTTFATTMAELVKRGDVAERYVAYRGSYPRPARVSVPLCCDLKGDGFLVVTNYAGDYQDAEEAWHNACKEGYSRIFKQYLYCFEAVNARIARLEGRPGSVVPRFSSPKKEAPPSSAQGTIATVSSAPCNDDGGAYPKNTIPTASGGYLNSMGGVTFTGENTTDDNAPSMVPDVRTAPWTPETILALASHRLAVPPKPDERDQAAMERYLVQWYEPALWICHETADLEPRRAWEVTERCIVGALHGPTWQAKHRAPQGHMTLRNIVGPATMAKPLTGDTWRTLLRELDKEHWYPDATTPYDGPPLDYASGYQAVTPASAAIEEPPIIVEPPEVPTQSTAWMSKDEATDLCYEIWDQYPAIHAALTPLVDDATDRYYASIKVASGDQWYHLQTPDAWRLPMPETVDAINAALACAAPPPEPPPIIVEPPDSVAAQVLTEPLPALSMGNGMSLWIAEALLDRIERAGYSVQLHPIGEDRAYLSIETPPGTWTRIESAAAWQRHVKSVAQSPPGSIASVLATGNGVMQGVQG